MQQLTIREKDFIIEQGRKHAHRIGTVMEIRTSSGALRKGVVTNIEFDHFASSASGLSKCIVWKVTQELPRADGNGTVPRSITIRL